MKLFASAVLCLLSLSTVLNAATITYNMHGVQAWDKEYHVFKTSKYQALDDNSPARTYLQRITIYRYGELKNGKKSQQLIEQIDNVKQQDGNACVIHQTVNQIKKRFNYVDCRDLSKLVETKLPENFMNVLSRGFLGDSK